MEEDKQKKRNRKKKNKQKKAAEQKDNSASDPSHPSQPDETGSMDDNASDLSNLTHPVEDNHNPESHSNGINEFTVDGSSARDTGSIGPVSVTGVQQDWIKEEARLKMMIKELQLEIESRIQKEVQLCQLEQGLKGNRAKLETKLSTLIEEKDASCQKEAELEMKLSNLREERDVLRQKEITLEEKIILLMQEEETLCMKESSLLEKVKLFETEKDLWVREEDSNRQKIVALNDENARLRVQVSELDERGNKLLLEKQQLVENLAASQSRMEDLERNLASAQSSADNRNDASKIDELNSQIEAAFQLVERLITENADTVEKMNEMYAELGRWQATDRDLTATVPYSHVDSESGYAVSILSENANGTDQVLNMEEKTDTDHSLTQTSLEASMPGEIVQIPLDENEGRDIEGQVPTNESADGVPLTDAPLIGAPFRLISSMARYVSGADLVRDGSESGQ